MKKYVAILDDGHDFDEMTYYSNFRNKSKDNLEDARRELYTRKGCSAKFWEIIDTYLF